MIESDEVEIESSMMQSVHIEEDVVDKPNLNEDNTAETESSEPQIGGSSDESDAASISRDENGLPIPRWRLWMQVLDSFYPNDYSVVCVTYFCPIYAKASY